jgi:diguanylate cyclase (GGDEF)-like protein/PAS domain S-box-containing protein
MKLRISPWRSLHVRLLGNLGLSLAAGICLAGLALMVVGNNFIKQRTIKDLSTIANMLAENTAFQLGLNDPYYSQEVANSLAASRYHGDVNLVCLYAADGTLYAQYSNNGRRKCDDSTSVSSEKTVNKGVLRTSVNLPIYQEGNLLGEIRVHSQGKELQQVLMSLGIAMILTFGIALILALLLGRKLIHNSLAPLRNLSDTSKNIAENPFSNARAIKTFQDEVGLLVDVFNSMLDVLSQERRDLLSSEERFRNLSENSPVGVFLREDAENFNYVNSTWCELTGLDNDQAFKFTEHIDNEYLIDYEKKFQQLCKGSDAIIVEYKFDTRLGHKRHFMEYISKVSDPNKGSLYIGSLLDVTDLKDAQLELEQLAYYDPLTKLPNRRYLRDHLTSAIAKAKKDNRKIAVFMTDLDDFKKVNDSLGHDAGDKLLSQIGESLRQSVFEEDIVARLGGDEFMVLIEDIDNLNSLEFVAKRLLKGMQTEATYEHGSLPVTGSIGAAIYPDDACNYEELLRFADMALYSSKSKGGDAFNFYSADLDQKIREQIRIEHKLRVALDNNSLEVFLQPIFHAKSQNRCWAEALVRWFDEEEGSISPGIFIPVAETTGLIHQLGDFVLERVCQIIESENSDFEKLGINGISVNLSAKQFYSKDLVKRIRTLMNLHNVRPSQLCFEITESMVMDDIELAISTMEEINSLGCTLSIDDFGTGYSSLTYLKRFPVDNLKIDRSFIKDLPDDKNDAEIACAIIDLAHNLGMKVVAEGVETPVQADFLAQKGAEYLQGFLLSRPVSVSELKLQLTNHSTDSIHDTKTRHKRH